MKFLSISRSLTVLVVSFWFSIGSAVFTDEAFVTDWINYQYGKFIPSSLNIYPEHQAIISLTDTNHLLSLDLNNGSINWRHQLEFNGGDLVYYGDHIISGLNNNGTSDVKIWNIDGSLVDQRFDHGGSIVKLFNFRNQDVLVLYENGELKSLYDTKKTINLKTSKIHSAFISSYNENTILVISHEKEVQFFVLTPDLDIIHNDYISSSTNVVGISGNAISFEDKVAIINSKFKVNQFTKIPHFLYHDSYLASYDEGSSILTIEDLDTRATKEVSLESPISALQATKDHFVVYTQASISKIDLNSDYLTSTFQTNFPSGFKLISTQIVDEQYNIYTFYETDSHTHVLQNNETLWDENFILSRIIDHTVLGAKHDIEETTYELMQEKTMDIFSAYVYRLKNTWKKITTAKSEEAKTWDDKDNYFGFVQKLIVSTESKKIVAINTETGDVLWTYDSEMSDPQVESSQNLVYVFGGNEAVILNSDGYLWSRLKFESSIERVLKFNDIIYVKFENGKFEKVTQNNEEIKQIAKISDDGSSLCGYTLKSADAIKKWKHDFEEEVQILAIASRSYDDKSASIGVVLGDKTVLYKYLYPNVAAFAMTNKDSTILTINLIDTLTSELLYSKQEIGLFDASSLNIVFGEHWIVYSYLSYEPTFEQKIVVLDLFESLQPNERTDSSNNLKINSLAVSSETFVFPDRITRLGISKTKFGVTIRSVIAATSSGQLVSIPKFILNSRRVHGRPLTPEEMQEFRLSAYEKVVRKVDHLVLNHVRPISRIKEIISIPTELESTSIICAYGDDLFCTRIQPSNQFDTLGASFDKLQLLVSIALVIVGVFVTKPLVDSKRLNARWIDTL